MARRRLLTVEQGWAPSPNWVAVEQGWVPPADGIAVEQGWVAVEQGWASPSILGTDPPRRRCPPLSRTTSIVLHGEQQVPHVVFRREQIEPLRTPRRE